MIDNTIDKTVGMLQRLTEKLINLKQKADQNSLLNQEYEDLSNKIDILSAMINSNNSSSESDLVALGILPKPIAEFTNDDIGTEISIPYTDAGGVINGPIIFEVVGVNHHKDINTPDKPTITLMTKQTIRRAAFDAKEPNNSDSTRAERGNNRWALSNIRQWLNSEGAANEWFTPQHEYDEASTADNVSTEVAAYADEPGFLAGFSQDIKSHFATVANTTWVYGTTSTTDITNDKVFLASYTEIGFGNNNGIAEGTYLSVRYSDDNSRIKSGASGFYWLRSAFRSDAGLVWTVMYAGYEEFHYAFNSEPGIVPLVVLM